MRTHGRVRPTNSARMVLRKRKLGLQVFAKLKALLRKAAERTVEALWNRIGDLLDAFSPKECVNDFKNAGYASG
jgi:hypothetical protein